MSRVWNNDRIDEPLYWPDVPPHWWVMRCDREGCSVVSWPFSSSPDTEPFHRAGWFIAKVYGDHCPVCVVKGLVPANAESRYPEEAVTP